METNKEQLENGLDQFLGKDQVTDTNQQAIDPKKVVKKKGDLVEKVEIDTKLIVEDGRELLREITYNRY